VPADTSLPAGTVSHYSSVIAFKDKDSRLAHGAGRVGSSLISCILVQDGQIIVCNLRRERLTHGDIEEEARRQQITSLENVRWAILEKEGSISFIPKS
jgi:hypothetical protein